MINLSNFRKCSIDIDGLEQQFGFERTILLLETFVEETDRRMFDLEKAAAVRNSAAVLMVAHSLKGVSGMLQAKSLELLCRKTEEAARAGDWNTVDHLVQDLRREFSLLRRDLPEH